MTQQIQGLDPITIRGQADAWLEGNYWIGVYSTNLKSIRYNKKREELYIEFLSKKNTREDGPAFIYRYPPENIARDLFNARSKGIYFDSHIKKHYACEGPLAKLGII